MRWTWVLLALGLGGQGAWAQEPEAPPLPAQADGGLGSAFLEGFREGLEESQHDQPEARPGQPELSDDQAVALGFASLCCCFLVLAGLVVLVVVLVRKASRAPAPDLRGGWAPAPGMAPPAAPTAALAPHLSVLAVALDARVRAALEAALRATGVDASPTTVAQRSQLVRALCRALLEHEGNWRAFGYGDKADFADARAAEASFRAAWADFRGRCQGAGESGGELTVAVLVLCTRGPVLGTTRLEDAAQARALVEHRLGLGAEALLAADCFFAPAGADAGALSSGDAYRRFPEMKPLERPPGAP